VDYYLNFLEQDSSELFVASLWEHGKGQDMNIIKHSVCKSEFGDVQKHVFLEAR